MIMMSALGGLWLCVWWEVEEVDRAVHLSSGGSDPEDGRWRQSNAESPALGSLALNAELGSGLHWRGSSQGTVLIGLGCWSD